MAGGELATASTRLASIAGLISDSMPKRLCSGHMPTPTLSNHQQDHALAAEIMKQAAATMEQVAEAKKEALAAFHDVNL